MMIVVYQQNIFLCFNYFKTLPRTLLKTAYRACRHCAVVHGVAGAYITASRRGKQGNDLKFT